jgi:hypothetical protein
MSDERIRRSIGRRAQRPFGPLRTPTAEEYAWSKRMAGHRSRVPKGVFRYSSMVEANADWERWHADLVAAVVGGASQG